MPDLSSETVLLQLQPIFQEALDEPGLAVNRGSNAANTPKWDSLAHVELIEMVLCLFKERFALGELQDLKQVGDLVDLTVEKLAKN